MDEEGILRLLLGGRPTADLMFSICYKSDAPWNESFWKNPKFDPLLIAVAPSSIGKAQSDVSRHAAHGA